MPPRLSASPERLAEALRARWSARDDRYFELRGICRKSGRKVYPKVRLSLVGGRARQRKNVLPPPQWQNLYGS
jgi:hypothetical protein